MPIQCQPGPELPAFLSVIYGNEEPTAAIACVEAGQGQAEEAPEGDDSGDA
jgi:hypothetical protein